MKKNYNHIAIIPARKNSVGYPKKNRIFFKDTQVFLKKIKWFKNIYLSSDDLWFKEKCEKYNYHFIKRNSKLAKHNTSITEVMTDFVKKKKLILRQ
jgi:CMP-N-acetylneuraminic acid synthetase